MKALYYFYKYVRYNLLTIIKSLITVTLGIVLLSNCLSLFNQTTVYKRLYNDDLANSIVMRREWGSPDRTQKDYVDDENFKNIGFLCNTSVCDARNPNVSMGCNVMTDNVAEAFTIPLSAGDGFNPSLGRAEVIVSYDLRKVYKLGEEYEFLLDLDRRTVKATVVGHTDKNSLMPRYFQAFQYMYDDDIGMTFAGGDACPVESMEKLYVKDAIIFGTTDAEYYNSLNLYDTYMRVADSYAEYIDYMERDSYTYGFLTAIVFAIVLFGVGASEILGFDSKRRSYAVRYLCGERPVMLISLRLITSAIILLIAASINLISIATAPGSTGMSMTLGNVLSAVGVAAGIYIIALIPSFALQLSSKPVDELRGAL